MNLILCNGFNYYNRIIKKYDSYSDYFQFMDKDAPILENINFNPADGVTAKQIVNWTYACPDYLVCINENNEIDSRWYVVEATRTRAGQLDLTLKRDLIVDYYDYVVNSPTFIEKATINNINDIAIYNSEDIKFNQIKKSEELLKDETDCAWIVGYFTRPTSDITVNVPVLNLDVIGTYNDQAACFAALGCNASGEFLHVKHYDMQLKTDILPSYIGKNSATISFTSPSVTLSGQVTTMDACLSSVSTGNKRDTYLKGFCNTMNKIFPSITRLFINYAPSNYHRYSFANDGKYVIVNNTYYKIIATKSTEDGTFTNISTGTSWANKLYDIVHDVYYLFSLDPSHGSSPYTGFQEKFIGDKYQIRLQEVVNQNFTTQISAGCKILQDAPYSMFCIPAGSISVSQGLITTNTVNKDIAINTAIQIAMSLTGASIMDLQLLPYCPLREYVSTSGSVIQLPTNLIRHLNYEYIMESNAVRGYVFYGNKSTFEFNIAKSILLDESILNRKITNQCDLYRLCSPNYASLFDFNLLKTGNITQFNIDCTYKPYTPYIHVNPNWEDGSLYGEDFNDVRGLICSGDFSLPIANDQWKTYMVNNKNYINSFNREIASLELQNKYQRVGDVANAITGAVGSTIKGATTGGVVGAVAGGIVGTATGIADIGINELLRQDAVNLKKDQFNYSLDNIQALPNTVSKISSVDANNKIFPLLEYYSCTEQEKEIFKNKMVFNGMTIGRIDKIINFIGDTKNYIKGRIIRIEGLNESTHEFMTIMEELMKGVYI